MLFVFSDRPSSPAGEALEASRADAARIETFLEVDGDEEDLLVGTENKAKRRDKKSSVDDALTVESPDEVSILRLPCTYNMRHC